VVQDTLDGLPQAPGSLTRTARNETCLSLTWTRPVVTNGQVTAYKVKPTGWAKKVTLVIVE